MVDLLSIRRVARAAVAVALAAVLVALLAAGSGCGKKSGPKSTTCMSDGEEALAAGRIHRAVNCFEKEIELNPKNPAPYLRLALIYEHIYKDAAKADEYYGRYLEIETSEVKRQMVQRWRSDLDTTAAPDDLPPLLEGGATDGGSLVRRLDEARRTLRETEKARDEFAQKIIALEGVQEQLKQSQATVSRISTELDTLKTQSGARDKTFADLKKAYDDLKAQGDAAQGASTDEIALLKQQVAGLEAENQQLAARNTELEDEQSRAGRRSLTDKLDEAREALKAAQQENEQYARRIAELEARLAQLEAGTSTTTTTTGPTRTHVVREGETLSMISLKYYGTKDRWRDIYDANRDVLPDPNHIQAGQKLTIPLRESQ